MEQEGKLIFGFRYPDKPVETSPDVVGGLPEAAWIAQAKYDGWRLQVYVDGPGSVRCLTRLGRPMAEIPGAQFPPEIPRLFQQIKVPGGTVLDSEFVGPRGHLPFAVYIFDMLAWDGEWLVNESYEKRWKRCLELDIPEGLIDTAATVETDFVGFFNRLRTAWDGESITLHEGIVVKARKGKMKLDRKSSKKSDVMLKLKYREIQAARY
ncbi:MAG: hypothetical protein ACXAC5_01385 [Promethearchaeota archaeon]|jgi:ATP-dependent DNA ligase